MKFFPLATHRVAGRSMVPTFVPSHRVLVNKVSYALRSPRTGDIVVLKHPSAEALLVKRVIAGEGSEVTLRYGRLFVDNKPADSIVGKDMMSADTVAQWRVPKGKYFVAGDNLHASTDSRHFGCVAKKHIKGKVIGSFLLEE
ncbi:MAG: signal peptidase I, partial [Candidatus Spechtbacterales bacterium]